MQINRLHLAALVVAVLLGATGAEVAHDSDATRLEKCLKARGVDVPALLKSLQDDPGEVSKASQEEVISRIEDDIVSLRQDLKGLQTPLHVSWKPGTPTAVIERKEFVEKRHSLLMETLSLKFQIALEEFRLQTWSEKNTQGTNTEHRAGG
jgi:hypothetical protein